MNRCCICDVTDEDNPKANIKCYDVEYPYTVEFRCLECHKEVEKNLEELSIADEDFIFSANIVEH